MATEVKKANHAKSGNCVNMLMNHDLLFPKGCYSSDAEIYIHQW